jgi:stage III sporulation protein AE
MVKRKLFFICFFCICILVPVKVYGSEQEVEEISNDIDFTEIQEVLNREEITQEINFKEMVEKFISGEEEISFGNLAKICMNRIFGEMSEHKNAVIQIILLAMVAAIFTNFSSVFDQNHISETGFYVTYMLLVTILLSSFTIAAEVTKGTIETLLNFMEAIVPAYYLSVAFASGSSSSVVFYQFTLMLLTAVNIIIVKIVIPLIHIYVILVIGNHISKEDMLSKLAELLKTAIEWILKSMLAVVIGFNVVQGMIAPVIDSVKTNILNKTMGVIPGIGNALNAVTETVIGSGVLIKNGIGMAGFIIILLLCGIPIIKIGCFFLFYRLSAAFIQPVSDKRIVECIGSVGNGTKLLLQSVFTGAMLFLITIALVTASTSASYYAG